MAANRQYTLQDLMLRRQQEEDGRRAGLAAPRAPSNSDIFKNTAINAGKSYALKAGTNYLANQIPSALSTTGFAAAAAVPLAIAAQAYNFYDMYKNPPSRLEGALRGGLAGLGLSYLNKGYSKLEEDNRKALMKQYGIDLGKVKEWESNADFARTRDEKYLKPEDVDTAADWYMKFGPQYGAASDEVKRQLAQEAINRGILRERNGGIEIETDEEGGAGYEDWARGLLATPQPPARKSEPKKQEKKKQPAPERRLSLEEIMPKFTYTPQADDVAGREALFNSYLTKQKERSNRRI